MYRAPVGPQRSPGAPRLPGRFPSPRPPWGLPGPHGGSTHRGRSPWGCPPTPPGVPAFSPPSDRRDGWRPRGFGEPRRRGGAGFRFSPRAHNLQSDVQCYFSPSMLEDPWERLQPVSAAVAAGNRRSS